MINSIFSNSFNVLKTCLNGYKARNKAISSNIANSQVKNYHKVEVNFEQNLKKAINSKSTNLKTTNSKHFTNSSNINDELISVKKNNSPNVGNNKISLDEEMVKLADNQVNYLTTAKVLNRMFGILKTAIKGR